MGEQTNGSNFNMERTFNGPKLVIITISTLVLFTLLATLATYYGGRAWGKALDKKALQVEREVQEEKMRMREQQSN